MKNNILALLSVIFLTGCTAAIMQNALVKGPDDNMATTTYASADQLVQQAKSRISERTVIELTRVTNVDDLNDHTALGPNILERVGMRLTQLGYTVKDSRAVYVGAGSTVPSTSVPVINNNPTRVREALATKVSGTYTVKSDVILIKLQLADSNTGAVLATNDYNVHLTRDLKRMLGTDWYSIIKKSFDQDDQDLPAMPHDRPGATGSDSGPEMPSSSDSAVEASPL